MTSPRLALDAETFLARYWQREPLFIPGAITDFIPPISSDTLAGLAMEQDIVFTSGRKLAQVQNMWNLAKRTGEYWDLVRAGTSKRPRLDPRSTTRCPRPVHTSPSWGIAPIRSRWT